MDRETQLWIAAAGDDFTGIVTQIDNGTHSTLKVCLNGAVRASNGYVAYIITSSIDCVEFSYAEIDAHDMSFIDGRCVNQHSIECILIIMMAVIKRQRALYILVPDNTIKEVLESVFGSKRFAASSVSIHCMSKDSMRHDKAAA